MAAVTPKQLRAAARRFRELGATSGMVERVQSASDRIERLEALVEDMLDLLARMERDGGIRTPYPGLPDLEQRLRDAVAAAH